MKTIQVQDRTLGRGQPTLVIAEIGVNHDGSLARAIELTHIAAECGADAIKLQLFRADRLMHSGAVFAQYQQERVADRDPIAMLKRYELSDLDVIRVLEVARALGLIILATPFSLADVDLIEALDLPAIKIASPDVVNLPLLRRALRCEKPLIISTGAASVDEVKRCTEMIGTTPAALLHCVSSYPVDAGDANLAWIQQLHCQFNYPVGFSDHTTDERCGAMAVLAGACIVEKHLTFDRTATGPDHSASADPVMFRRYVQLIREAERWLGHSEKHVLPAEADVRRVSRQSLVLAKRLQAGAVITEAMLITQRPGDGISAAEVDAVIGRSCERDVEAGTMLAWDMLTPKLDSRAA